MAQPLLSTCLASLSLSPHLLPAGPSVGLPGLRESQQCRSHKGLSGDNSSFLPSPVPPSTSAALTRSQSCSQGLPEGPEQTPSSCPPPPARLAPAVQGSQAGAFGEEGCPRDAALLGNRCIYISVCDRGCGFKIGASRLEKSFWRKRSLAFSPLPPAVRSLSFFFFPWVCSFCWDRFQPDQLQLATLPPARSC